MEVSGRTGPSDSSTLCQPCQGDDDTIQAECFCENCKQFMCSACIKAHRKLPLTKNHVIKTKDEMPTSQTAQSDPCTELCDVHKNEIVKFYCKKHDIVGCGDCMVLKHTSCKVQLVSDVSCNYDDSDEVVLIKQRIKFIKKNIDSFKREIENSLQTADDIKTSIIKEIKQFRKEIDTYLDKITRDLIQEVEKVSTDDVFRQHILYGQCKATIEDVDKMQSKLQQCTDNINDLFVSSKDIKKKLQNYQKINEEISTKSQINAFKFRPSGALNLLKNSNLPLGRLEIQVQNFSGKCEKSIIDMKTQFVQKFKIKGKQKCTCDITGMTVISDAEILCADRNNTSLTVFNHKQGKITSTLKTSSFPADVTTINSSSAATTLPVKGKILFLNTLNGLSVSHSLKVREKCLGIDHHNGIISVIFRYPPAVHVIDMEGHILHEVRDTGILKWPQYVCLSNDNESMFVSDYDKGVVYEFTLTGQLINTIKSKEMKYPTGMTLTNCGNVVVCDLNVSDKVEIIVPGTRNILPLSIQNVLMPQSVIICKEQNKMFLSENHASNDSKFIKVFDLK